MANNKHPKNDFAPAWLRLPEPNPSPTVASSKTAYVRERKLDAHGSYGSTGYGYQPHSFFDHSESKEKFALDGESRLAYSVGHGTDYGADNYSSSLYRSSQVGQFRGSKAANSRTGQVNGVVNGGGYDYYDEMDDEHSRGQPWVGGGAQISGGVKRVRQQHVNDKDVVASRTNGRRQETMRSRRSGDNRDDDTDDSAVETRVKDEFPSLNGDCETVDQSGKAVAGAWEKPHGLIRMPPQGSQQTAQPPSSAPASPAGGWSVSEGGSGKKDNGVSQATCPSMYKALVPIPGKAILMRKPSRDAIKMMPTKEAGSSISQPSVKSPPLSRHRPTAESTASNSSSVASTPPTPITLNVTQPKKLGDKKSHFLRQFKLETDEGGVGDSSSASSCNRLDKKQHESKNADDTAETNDDLEATTDSMDLLKVAEPDETILSSSLEAEHRLLREMGWDEGAAEVCEITEEERREFEKQLEQKKQVKVASPSWKMSNGVHAENAAGSPRFHGDSEEDDDNDSDLDVSY